MHKRYFRLVHQRVLPGLLERMDKARSDRDTITAELARHVLRHEQSGARAAGKRPAEGAPGPAAPAPKQARAPPASFDWQVWSCETVPLIYAPDMPWNMPRMRENYAPDISARVFIFVAALDADSVCLVVHHRHIWRQALWRRQP